VGYGYEIRTGVHTDIANLAIEGFSNAITNERGPLSSSIDEATYYLNKTGSPITWYVVSTDANDTSAGSGAQTVRVWFSNSTGAKSFEDFTMNGTTQVASSSTHLNPLSAMVIAAGATTSNEGIIFLETVAGATERCISIEFENLAVPPGENFSYQGHYQPSLGETVYPVTAVIDADISGSQIVLVRLNKYIDALGLDVIISKVTVSAGGALNLPNTLNPPLAYPDIFWLNAERITGTGDREVHVSIRALSDTS
jgi:hypothetical protein